MKPHILFTVFLALSLSFKFSTAQDTRPQIKLQIGQSNTTDLFESKNPNKRESGYAEDGFVLGLGLQQPIIPMLDATAGVSFSNYALDGTPLLRVIETEAPSFNWVLDDGNYQVKNVTIGLRLYGGTKFKFYVNPIIGFSWISFPSIALEGRKVVKRETITSYSRENIETDRNFMIGVRGGLEYLVSENFGLNFQLEQIKYEFEADARVDFRDINQNEGSFTTDERGEYAVINITLGIIFKFDWKEEE